MVKLQTFFPLSHNALFRGKCIIIFAHKFIHAIAMQTFKFDNATGKSAHLE